MDRAVSQLVDFASNFSYNDLPAEAVAGAKQRVVDTIGCAIGGYISPPAHAARLVAYPTAARGARIWGSLTRITAEEAAFANGVALRYLDFNDAYRGSVDVGHPSDNLGALIACAEECHASGRSLIEAMAIAYEVQMRLAESVPLNDLGWDQPTAVVISSALGCGKLLGLSRDQFAETVSLAIVPNVALHQTRVGELSWWKGCAAAMGARQGLFAARLAAAGMTGPQKPIEGKNGLWAQLGGDSEYEIAEPGRYAPVWGVQQSNIKTWPVRDSCQIAIDTARTLRAQGVRADGIERLHVQTYKSSYRWAVADPELWAPKTRETADHSMPFSIAVTLIDGGVRPATFTERRFLDDDVLRLISRMNVEVSDGFTAQTPGTKNCAIEATLTSGETRRAHTALTQEEIEGGWPDEVIERKFRQLTSDLFLDSQLDEALETLWRLEELPDVSLLVDLLHV